jgi:hypothetical protein
MSVQRPVHMTYATYMVYVVQKCNLYSRLYDGFVRPWKWTSNSAPSLQYQMVLLSSFLLATPLPSQAIPSSLPGWLRSPLWSPALALDAFPHPDSWPSPFYIRSRATSTGFLFSLSDHLFIRGAAACRSSSRQGELVTTEDMSANPIFSNSVKFNQMNNWHHTTKRDWQSDQHGKGIIAISHPVQKLQHAKVQYSHWSKSSQFRPA